MPILMTLRMRRPVCPFHASFRMLSENRAIRSSTACTSGTTFLPSTRIEASFGARSAVCKTARPSETLILSPRNIASIRPRRSIASARSNRSPSVSSVIRFFE